MIVVDTLVHNFFTRTDILDRFGMTHAFGPACYRQGACATIIRDVSARINARAYHPGFPVNFPHFIQHAIWRYCAQDGLDISSCLGGALLLQKIAAGFGRIG
jgi:hypothetical protein